jgi:hypothetical protein
MASHEASTAVGRFERQPNAPSGAPAKALCGAWLAYCRNLALPLSPSCGGAGSAPGEADVIAVARAGATPQRQERRKAALGKFDCQSAIALCRHVGVIIVVSRRAMADQRQRIFARSLSGA